MHYLLTRQYLHISYLKLLTSILSDGKTISWYDLPQIMRLF